MKAAATGAVMQISLLLLLLCAPLLLLFGPASAQFSDGGSGNSPTVNTNYGRVRGYTQDIGVGRTIASYIGIPFAAAPTRGNRFREPMPPARWQGDFDATRNRVSCPQTDQRFQLNNNIVNIREDEDCLYLNVFVPQRVGLPQRLPVVVYLHGGEFKYGGKDYYQPNYLLQHDVILVVPNYRLGVLGFMSTDDDHSPGNYGLRDQIMALRWVQSEIFQFGGEPSMVTIMGHDAGAISVNILMLTKQAENLFNRSISAGGTVFTPWAFQEDPTWRARDFGRFFNCHDDSQRLVRCLRDKSASELMSTARAQRFDHFRPTVDFNVSRWALLQDWPIKLYEQNNFIKVPYLCGLTAREGALEYYLQFGKLNSMFGRHSSTRDRLEELFRPFLRRYTNAKVIAAAADYQYIQRFNLSGGGSSAFSSRQRMPAGARQFPLDNNMFNQHGASSHVGLQQPFFNIDDKFVDIMGDFLYNAPTDMALKAHSRSGAPTFLYVLSYVGTKSFGPLQRDAPKEILRDSYGVTHMDDSLYILPSEYNPQEMDAIGRTVGASLTRCILQFIHPNSFSGPGCTFKSYNHQEQPYLSFAQAFPQPLMQFKRPEVMSFWNDLVFNMIEYTATPPPYFQYREFEAYKAATWSMLAFILILVLLVAVLAAVLCLNKRKETNSLKLLRARDRELEDRYNDASQTERL